MQGEGGRGERGLVQGAGEGVCVCWGDWCRVTVCVCGGGGGGGGGGE